MDERDQRTRAQVWDAIRRLSDAELARVQRLLLVSQGTRFAPEDPLAPRKDAVRIPLTLVDEESEGIDDNQADNDVRHSTEGKKSSVTQWSPTDLIHAFLSHLHQVVHFQQATIDATSAHAAVRTTSGTDAAAAKANGSSGSGLLRVSKSAQNSSSRHSPFALQSDDFPSLRSGPTTTSATNPVVGKPAVKTAKRRITTTLLSDQNVITRPVLNSVAFPPLGGVDQAAHSQTNNPWAKRELLERRMVSTVEADSSGSSLASPPPSKPWGQQRQAVDKSTETRVSSAARVPTKQQHLDDSPQGGSKRVQPFPVTTPISDASSNAVCNSPMVTPLKSAARPPPMLLCVKQKRSRRQALLSNNTESSSDASLPPELDARFLPDLPADRKKHAEDLQMNVQAAKLYGFLIHRRFVGSTCTELQLLISLLFRTNCIGSSTSSEPTHESTTTACGFSNEFCWRSHCLEFASIAFSSIESMLGSLGADLLRLLMSSLADAEICTDLLERLRKRAQRREELRVEESARIGCKLPVETKASAVRDFALPFCEEIDSRLHYRSPTESVMYSNREKVRDGFLDLLRQFQKQQHSLVGIENASVAASAIENAKRLLCEVAPENRWWFAKFFVMELIQVGSNPFGESDKDLVLKIMEDKLVVKNPDRLRKLHRRFTSQKQSSKAPTSSSAAQGVAGNNPAKNFGSLPSKSNGGGGSGRSDRHEHTFRGGSSSTAAASNGSNALTATFENTRGYFAENQQFFFHFLHSCDSYEFSQLVKYQLEFQFQSIWKENVNADPRKTFTEVVLKLKAVAKFLGYLRFSPQWHNSSSLVQLSKQNPAFKAAEKEAVWTLENADSLGLDVKLLLERSILESKISKCVPWLCDYLTMLSLDKLSSATTYFKQLLVLLERIYHSPRLDGLGETGLYVGMQIERVFHVLELDLSGFFDDAQFRSPSLQPSTSLLLVLEKVESSVPSGEDHLPFLYSQVFVQSCVNELEDLRGFIQTRAKPSHRVTKRIAGAPTSGPNQQLTAIRKLRPLQVITEDEHSDDLLSKAADASTSIASTALTDEDKLSDSIFKIHPNLKKVVEFVVEVVATNICEHVLQRVVTPSADAFVDSCVWESGLNPRERFSSSSSLASTELESATILFLQLLESRTVCAIRDTVVSSLKEAGQLCEDRVRTSIPHLIPPSCHPTLAQSVVLVALNRTRGVMTNLIPKSSRSEFTKRIAFRKKAILKETASRSVAQAEAAHAPRGSSGEEESDKVVRTLSSMFDEHAGIEDSNQEEVVLALKQASAQMFTLSRSSRSGSTVHEWVKLHASLSRYLRSFASNLGELEGDAGRPEQDRKQPHRRLYELPVWDATWRATISCLRVITRFCTEVVGAEWMEQSCESEAAKALEKSVTGFTESFISLVKVVMVPSTDDAEVRRMHSLTRVVAECLLAKPPTVRLPTSNQKDSGGRRVLQRFILSPRARILTVLASKGSGVDFMQQRHPPSNQSLPAQHLGLEWSDDANQFRSEVWGLLHAQHG